MKKLLFTALKVILFFIGWAVCAGLIDIPSDNPALWRLGAEAVPLIVVVIFSLVFWLIEKSEIKIISFQKPLLNISVGLITGIVWLGLAVVVMYLSGALSFSGSNQVPYLPVWLLACFLNVIMQEIVFRGYMYQLIKNKYNVAAAMITTTILFIQNAGA